MRVHIHSKCFLAIFSSALFLASCLGSPIMHSGQLSSAPWAALSPQPEQRTSPSSHCKILSGG